MPSTVSHLLVASALTLTAALAAADSAPAPKLSSQSLALIGEDQSGSVSELSAVSDTTGLRGILFKTIKGGTPGEDPLTKFTLAQITSATGVVLVKEQGYDAVILKAKNQSATKYSLAVNYLKNALASDYGSCSLSLEKGTDGSWTLKNAKSGAKISKIQVKTWTMGITSLDGACADATASN